MINLRLIKVYLLIAFCFAVAAETAAAFQPDAKAKELRRLFEQAVGGEFEIVRDEMRHRPRDTMSDYWLVHVKPRRSGYYTLKYSFKVVNAYGKHPEEGEHTMVIGVGGKRCYRHNNPGSGINGVCLGDTVIVPVRTVNATAHAFQFEAKHAAGGESLEEGQKRFKPSAKYAPVAPVANQLEANVKLLGTGRYEMPHRNCCPVTYEYYAVFEAVKPGRFNLGISSFEGDQPPGDSVKMNAANGTPIIIVNPETPVTTLVPGENTISYSDEKRFSAHAGNSFITNLLILQPGDIFTLRYSRLTIDYGFGAKSERKPVPDIKPAIYKLPFLLDKDWSFNEWLADYLPKGK